MFSWQALPKPFFVLAPMEGVTDTVFRQVIKHAGRPDVFVTEFISVEGFCSRGYPGMKDSLVFTESEKPIIAQLWGYTPSLFEKTAKSLMDMGYDGIDLNMGCPVKDVLKKGCGAAHCLNPSLAADIIDAVRQGVAGRGPVSVKTRIGVKEIITETWISFLLEQHLDALTVHGRTAKEMSKVPAHWDEIGKAVDLRNRIIGAYGNTPLQETVIIGNGDVERYEEGLQKQALYGVDGVMIGRGIFKNPWVFNKPNATLRQGSGQARFALHAAKVDKVALLNLHLDLFEKTWAGKKPAFTLRKFFKIYVQGFEGALDARVRLMEASSIVEMREIIKTIL